MPLASDARAIARAGVRAVDPGRAVVEGLRDAEVRRALGLRSAAPGRLHVVAFGKAAPAMARAALAGLGRRVAGGLVVTRRGSGESLPPLVGYESEHPVPGRGSVAAGRAALDYVGALRRDDRVLFLVSGGGSALLEAPADPVTLADLQPTTELLLDSGAPIQAMNAVRRHLSLVKGGGLVRATRAGACATLAVGDVVGDAPEEIASGPTVPDPTTYSDAWGVVERYGLAGRLPARVVRRLTDGRAGRCPETEKPGHGRASRAPFRLVATNRRALEAAAAEARRRGYRVSMLSSRVTGESRDLGGFHGELLRELAGSGRPGSGRCLLSGGETTVTITGRPGRGGRNQEFALAAAAPLDGLPGVVLLSAGTDGVDGPTDAAGGWVDGATLARARRRGVDLEGALDRHDAYPALERLGTLLKTGPTGTNVMDLHVGLTARTRRR